MKNVSFVNSFRQIPFGSNDLVIIDRKVCNFPFVKTHLKNSLVYSVTSGEKLKDIKCFHEHIEKIIKLTQNIAHAELRVVAVGGGSIGDFGGFVASVFKRGVNLIHVPTTWLAALDSSHGGKTALNVGNFKNQIGTFYPASEIFICREILFKQPQSLALDAFGEMFKTFLLDARLAKTNFLNERATPETLWKYLNAGILYKYKIVDQDPFEKKGIRSLLNFGHTMGHTWEMLMGWSHGKSVLYGLAFDIFWAENAGILSEKNLYKVVQSPLWREIFNYADYEKALRPSRTQVAKLVRQDKKKVSGDSIRQVFLKSLGQPKVYKVTFNELLTEYERQKKYFN